MTDQPTPVPLDQLRVDERYWPQGASEVVRRWLAEEYDPSTMPPLVVAKREDGHYVLGWRGESPSLFRAVYGRDMTRAELKRATS